MWKSSWIALTVAAAATFSGCASPISTGGGCGGPTIDYAGPPIDPGSGVKVADGPATAATTVYARLPVLGDPALGTVRSVWTAYGLGDRASAWEVVVLGGGHGVGTYWLTIDPQANTADELGSGDHVGLGQGVTGTVDTSCGVTRLMWNLGRFGYEVSAPAETFSPQAAERVSRRLVVAITRGETVGTLVTRDADLRTP